MFIRVLELHAERAGLADHVVWPSLGSTITNRRGQNSVASAVKPRITNECVNLSIFRCRSAMRSARLCCVELLPRCSSAVDTTSVERCSISSIPGGRSASQQPRGAPRAPCAIASNGPARPVTQQCWSLSVQMVPSMVA